MIKKILTKILCTILSVLCLVPSFNVYADEDIKYYSLDINSVSSDIKPYISAIYVDGETNSVYINNKYVGAISGSKQSFSLVEGNYTVHVNIDLETSSANAYVDTIVDKQKTALFSIDIAEKKYYKCTYYPDKDSASNAQTVQSTRNGDIHVFGPFSFEYGGKEETFTVQLVQSTGNVYVNGKFVKTLDMSTMPIVFEYIGEDFPLTPSTSNVNYMSSAFPKYTWPDAKTENRLFYDRSKDYFKNIAVTTEYTGTNEYLNLPSVKIQSGTEVEYHIRTDGTDVTGTGTWEDQGRPIEVVCEYYENNECGKSIRSEFPRYWAVYGQDLPTLSKVDKVSKSLELNITRYENVTWPEFLWIETDAYPSIENNTIVQYAKRIALWSNWTDWTSEARPNLACSGGNCKAESAKFYRNRTYSWQDTTDWHLTDNCPVSSTQQGIYRTTQNEICGVDYNECQHSDCGINQSIPYIYSNFGSYSTSKYGYQNGCAYRRGQNSECGQTYVRQGCSHNVSYSNNCGKCGTGQSCKTERQGYTCKKVVSTWRSTSECRSRCTGAYGCSGSSCYGTGTCYKDATVCSSYCKSCTLSEGYDCSYYETNTCTSYTCPNSRTDNYAYCHIAACGGAVARMCTQYKCQSKQYSAWSDYIYKDACPSDYWSECGDYDVKYRYQDRSWSDWYSWANTQSSMGNNSRDVEYKYRYNRGLVSQDNEKGTSTVIGEGSYWTGKVDDSKKGKQTVEIATINGSTYEKFPNKGQLTYDQVENFQVEWTKQKLAKDTYMQNKDKPNVAITDTGGKMWLLWENYEFKLNEAVGRRGSLEDIQNQPIYAPYLYFWGYRFVTSNQTLPSGNLSKLVDYRQSVRIPSNDSGISSYMLVLIESTEPATRDTKVIYFDYNNPLSNYKDELPENWQGYEYLIDEIKQTNIEDSIIRVEISRKDLSDMKQYLKDHGYGDSDCDMLREFSHIFKTQNGDLSDFLKGTSGCRIEEE